MCVETCRECAKHHDILDAITIEKARAKFARELLDVVLDNYPWRWGDGLGGSLVYELYAAAERRGLDTPGSVAERDRRDKTPAEQTRAAFNKKLRNKAIQAISVRDGWNCNYCDKVLALDRITIDHVTPVARAGTNDVENLVFACRRCNSSKKDLPLVDWLSKQAIAELI